MRYLSENRSLRASGAGQRFLRGLWPGGVPANQPDSVNCAHLTLQSTTSIFSCIQAIFCNDNFTLVPLKKGPRPPLNILQIVHLAPPWAFWNLHQQPKSSGKLAFSRKNANSWKVIFSGAKQLVVVVSLSLFLPLSCHNFISEETYFHPNARSVR